MSYNPNKPLTQQQIAEISKSEYRQYLQEQVKVGAAQPETFERYHLAVQKKFFDEDGVNRNQLFIVTCTKNEYNPRLGDYRHTLENQGYNVKTLLDPTAREDEEEKIIEVHGEVIEEDVADEHPVLESGAAKTGRGRKPKDR